MSQPSTTTESKPRFRLSDVRVTETELTTIKARAAESGLTMSEFQRRMCLDGKVVVQETATDVDAVRQLVAIGRNLNQLTKSGHINKAVNEAELTRTLERINKILDGFLP